MLGTGINIWNPLDKELRGEEGCYWRNPLSQPFSMGPEHPSCYSSNPTAPTCPSSMEDMGPCWQAGVPKTSIIPYVLCKSAMLKMYGVNYQGSLLGVKFIQ